MVCEICTPFGVGVGCWYLTTFRLVGAIAPSGLFLWGDSMPDASEAYGLLSPNGCYYLQADGLTTLDPVYPYGTWEEANAACPPRWTVVVLVCRGTSEENHIVP